MTSIARENRKVALQRTPLDDLHIRNGAKMVEFAGYSMPVQYDLGVMKEHLHTRSHAGLFDVSHMGQLAIRAHSGSIDEAKRALEKLVPCDLGGLAVGRQRYTQLTNEAGGIRDDLMVANLDNHLLLVVNASRKSDDEDYLIERLARICVVELLSDRALIALQGPRAERVLSAFVPNIESLRFMDVRKCLLAGTICIVSRSGYTGEDGFEISVPSAKAMEIGQALLETDAVELIGLGARDTLRLEAGLCLHGADINESINPVEAGLEWSIQKVRRLDGARGGDFVGADAILRQLASGPARRRVGIKPEGRAPIRHGAVLFPDKEMSKPIGVVTSGGFSPTLGVPIAMALVEQKYAGTNERLFADVRGQGLPVSVSSMPFVPHRYKRG